MALKISRFVSKLWQGVGDRQTQAAIADLAQKVEELARQTSPGLVWPDGIVPSLVPCPPGWELVTELVGRMPLGADPANRDAGATGGSMTHTHTIAHDHTMAHTHTIDHGHTAPSTGAAGSHSHSVEVLGESVLPGADPPVTVGADSIYFTDTAANHTHTVSVNNHTGNSGGSSAANTGGSSAANSGSTDATPAYVKVYFCRRIVPEGPDRR